MYYSLSQVKLSFINMEKIVLMVSSKISNHIKKEKKKKKRSKISNAYIYIYICIRERERERENLVLYNVHLGKKIAF